MSDKVIHSVTIEGKEITSSMFTDAVRRSAEKWMNITRGYKEGSSCALCNLFNHLPHVHNDLCNYCPLHEKGTLQDCCSEYFSWKANKIFYNASLVLARIQKISWYEWSRQYTQDTVIFPSWVQVGKMAYWDGVSAMDGNIYSPQNVVLESTRIHRGPRGKVIHFEARLESGTYTFVNVENLRPVKTSVTIYDDNGGCETYYFFGDPDFKRIERETIGAGKLAAIVYPYKLDGELEPGYIRLAANKLGMCSGGFSCLLNTSCSTWYYQERDSLVNEILQSISNFKAKEKKHKAGEICTAERSKTLPPAEFEGYIFKFTGEHRKASEGEYILCDEFWGSGTGKIDRSPRSCEGNQWILIRERKQKFQVGDWVVPSIGKPAQVTQYDSGVYWIDGDLGWVESDLRLAVREDFMKKFDGVKMWMETDERHTYGCFIMEQGTAMRPVLNPVEVLIYRAAGIMDMPKQFR